MNAESLLVCVCACVSIPLDLFYDDLWWIGHDEFTHVDLVEGATSSFRFEFGLAKRVQTSSSQHGRQIGVGRLSMCPSLQQGPPLTPRTRLSSPTSPPPSCWSHAPPQSSRRFRTLRCLWPHRHLRWWRRWRFRVPRRVQVRGGLRLLGRWPLQGGWQLQRGLRVLWRLPWWHRWSRWISKWSHLESLGDVENWELERILCIYSW